MAKSHPKKGPPLAASASAPRRGQSHFISFGLAALVFVVFLPALGNGFVNLDDPLYVTANDHVRGGFSWASLRWAFTSLAAGNWHPLTWLSHMLDCALYGLKPAGHHFTNVLLHAANTVALFLFLYRASGAVKRSAVVAALFAFHPLHVETVAWIADRKDVLAGTFWMLTLWSYAGYANARGAGSSNARRLYGLTLLAFVAAVMCKPSVITLPVVLLLLDWWPLKRWEPGRTNRPRPSLGPLLVEKIPFLVIGLLAGVIGIVGQKTFGALPGTTDYPLFERAANAVLASAQYLGQVFWPANLSAYYPYPRSFPPLAVAGAALLAAAITVAVLRRSRMQPELAVGWFWYGVTLLPALGLIQIGGHARADRYTYLPLIGIFIALVWGVVALTRRWRTRTIALSVLTAAALAACLVVSWRQTGYWRDSVTLLEHALSVTPENGLARNNLGTAFAERGQMAEAIAQWEEAVKLMPDYAEARNNLGAALGRLGQHEAALEQLTAAVRLKPGYAEAHCNLGDLLTLLSRRTAAIEHYEAALRGRPHFTDAAVKLARVLAAEGRTEEAVEHLRRAIQFNPSSAEAHSGLGWLLAGKDQFAAAIPALREAIRLNPNLAEACCNLGIVLGRIGKLDEAILHLREAVRLNPNYAEARSNLELALRLKANAPAPATTP